MTLSLPLSTAVMRTADIIATDMDGETVMMSIEHGEYYGLSEVGSFLWEQLAGPLSVEELCRRVIEEFDVDETTCRTDVSAFIAEMLEIGVLQRAG